LTLHGVICHKLVLLNTVYPSKSNITWLFSLLRVFTFWSIIKSSTIICFSLEISIQLENFFFDRVLTLLVFHFKIYNNMSVTLPPTAN
jgi:hypothetical protein